MIIQGTNRPLVLTIPESALPVSSVHVGLYSSGAEVKHWGPTELTVSDATISCPLTQQETIAFPAGNLDLEAKWLDADGFVCFSHRVAVVVVARNDKDVLEGG